MKTELPAPHQDSTQFMPFMAFPCTGQVWLLTTLPSQGRQVHRGRAGGQPLCEELCHRSPSSGSGLKRLRGREGRVIDWAASSRSWSLSGAVPTWQILLLGSQPLTSGQGEVY